MRNQGGVQLERIIRKRKLRHAAIERMVGYSEGSGLVTRIVNGDRLPTMKQAAVLERELGIPMSAWTVPAPEDEDEASPNAAA